MINFLFDKNITLDNDLTKMQLRGNVKELIIRFNKEIDPKYSEENLKYFRETDRRYFQDYYFDSNGNLREKVYYDYYDLVSNIQYFSYNIKNELTYILFKQKDKLGSMSFKHIYYPKSILIKHRTNGKKDKDTTEIVIKKDGIIAIKEKKHLWSRTRIKSRTYKNGKILEKMNFMGTKKFHYDNKNNLVRIEYWFNEPNYCYLSKNYEYNNQNELVSCQIMEEDQKTKPKLRGSYKYMNDSFGNWIFKEITNPNDRTITKVNRTIKYYSH